jgi:hypothetical protein
LQNRLACRNPLVWRAAKVAGVSYGVSWP